ncbi:Putative membrane lipoprotein [Arabidopsis thaliana]|uniref:Protein LURE 1.5 n=1 Tax=Arabidopsis thaliana TaxID=3702 RepID=LUR15_ARATH|nr:Putative membrane lipoprotein [Arabidopsis thaliana]A8MRC6.1 RecName: Full=Protein LURE 1.5; Short=AtLURE1.5; AltName: Full=Cysteine-Rich Peptide 810_1.5; Short=CRP810_1.5; AltName: Full=Defensin-like protein 212; Flags: Precursor [Arabidopsis thaliana]AED94977.1 Putative membrane lipoprotein [Arabidopsis thaliana]|eukprot:NP_001032005.1 Putative membrane lipoprotein [Arabidopsis thaliana]
MKLPIIFLTLLIFVSSCTSVLINGSSDEERTYSFSPRASPFDPRSLNQELKIGRIGYCFDCARACMRRGKYIRTCSFERKLCRYSISDIK